MSGEIVLDTLVKRYGDVLAVDGVSLEMPGGEFFHQDVRVRLASGALVRCDVPNDGSAIERASGDPVCVHLPADWLRVLETQ